jgi:sugar O-acyltransferase (sialic acid O-acetyltransferase NeuD family)
MSHAQFDASEQVDSTREPAPEQGACEEQAHELYLAGSGSFATEVAEWAQDAGWTVAGLVELIDASRIGSSREGRPVVAATARPRHACAILATGGDRRERWKAMQEHGWPAATVVHPRAHVSRSAKLGAGCIVGPGAMIGAETTIGEHTLVSRGALVGHHARVDAFVSLMPGVNLGGHVEVGLCATIGMGAVIVNSTRVGANVTVAAGAVVLQEVRDGVRVQGMPAKEYRG